MPRWHHLQVFPPALLFLPETIMSHLTRRQFSLGLGAILPLSALPACAATLAVTIEGMKFNEASLNVAVGDSVTFTNADGAPHTTTAKYSSFDTGTLKKGESATIAFASAGTSDYFCAVHPSMKGQIIVG
jgi:plastocyanin